MFYNYDLYGRINDIKHNEGEIIYDYVALNQLNITEYYKVSIDNVLTMECPVYTITNHLITNEKRVIIWTFYQYDHANRLILKIKSICDQILTTSYKYQLNTTNSVIDLLINNNITNDEDIHVINQYVMKTFPSNYTIETSIQQYQQIYQIKDISNNIILYQAKQYNVNNQILYEIYGNNDHRKYIYHSIYNKITELYTYTKKLLKEVIYLKYNKYSDLIQVINPLLQYNETYTYNYTLNSLQIDYMTYIDNPLLNQSHLYSFNSNGYVHQINNLKLQYTDDNLLIASNTTDTTNEYLDSLIGTFTYDYNGNMKQSHTLDHRTIMYDIFGSIRKIAKYRPYAIYNNQTISYNYNRLAITELKYSFINSNSLFIQVDYSLEQADLYFDHSSTINNITNIDKTNPYKLIQLYDDDHFQIIF